MKSKPDFLQFFLILLAFVQSKNKEVWRTENELLEIPLFNHQNTWYEVTDRVLVSCRNN